MSQNSIENIGYEFVKGLFGLLEFDITEFCNAAVDTSFEYCIKEFKKACKEADISWNKKWEDILYGE